MRASRFGQRGDQEIERGREHADGRCHEIVPDGAFQKVEIADTYAQSHADDGAHQGRNEHGADDDGRGVDVESERGDEDGEHQNPQVGAMECDATADLSDGLLFAFLVGQGVEVALHNLP